MSTSLIQERPPDTASQGPGMANTDGDRRPRCRRIADSLREATQSGGIENRAFGVDQVSVSEEGLS
ncbi:hypothetical protein TNCT1_01310 [Streptomyces sp. 1-11]|nr:hypothetical protein TNCT1_01310 [Streptomyces sp. 1-11]